jgi:uncharacterized protein with beta-barrel porin domain
LAQGLGSGRSDAFQTGVCGATRWGPVYVAAAFAFINDWMSADRFAFASDHLTANFNAQSVSGRIEDGYRFVTSIVEIAIEAQSFHTPSYSETGTLPGGFALAFGVRDAIDTRRSGCAQRRAFAAELGPDAGGSGASVRQRHHVLAKFEGEFASNSSTYAGMGTFRYRWRRYVCASTRAPDGLIAGLDTTEAPALLALRIMARPTMRREPRGRDSQSVRAPTP